MDTKLKKWKSIISFTAFAVGVSMMLSSGISLLVEIGAYGSGRGFTRDLKECFQDDYQQTDSFRYYMENRLENFLTMAAGGLVNGYSYWSGNNYYGELSHGSDYGSISGVAIMEDVESAYYEALESAEQSGSLDSWEDYDYEQWMKENISPEKVKKVAEAYHDSIKEDKNLLYVIEVDGKVRYSNSEEVKAAGDFMTAPEGYNFLMYFNGQKVLIQKDGKEMDIYGDNYYRDEDYDWYVPGYKNFVADESMKNVRIYMAAAKEPLLYTQSKAKESGYREANNQLYWIQYNMREQRDYFIRRAVFLIAGLVLLAVYFILRKSKKEADQALARVTGKIWFEPKLLLLLAGVMTLFFGSLYQYLENFGYTWGWTYSYEYAGYSQIFSEMMDYLVYNISPAGVVFLFWACYIVVNDIRKNHQTWKHGLGYKIYCVFSCKNMKQPLAKRLVRRCAAVFAVAFIYGIAAWAVITASVGSGFGSDAPWIYILLFLAGLIVMVMIQYYYSKGMRKTAEDMELLSKRISDIRDGDYEGSTERSQDSDLSATIDELEDIRRGMGDAVDEQMKSERMKVELIANVSHDIKTPLTSIISYVEFLKQEKDLPEHVKDYIRILDEKSQRLKNMVQDVFAVSKAASGELPVNMEILDFAKLLRQTMADMDEQIKDSSVTFKTDIPEEPILINADGQRLYRVFQNLFQNAIKYSLDGSRVYVTLKGDGSMAVASVKNTSRSEINQNMDYAERFTRGDGSRTDGGSGLGLSIAQSFTEACGGSFRLESIADLFVVTVSFTRTQDNAVIH